MTALASLPFVGWALFRLCRGELRWDYVAFLVVPLALALGTPAMKRLFVGLYPFGLVGLLYDAMRFLQNVGVTKERVHLCDLRDAEARLFGVRIAGERVTLHDVLQRHVFPGLDVLFALPYATFIFVCIGVAIFFWRRDFAALQRFSWAFFVLNLAGFATYHLYPAAPPWYFHAHGCVVDLAARASEGPNLARVDAWIGVPYFHGMYGRASDVFGAVPSLHVGYPLLIVLEGWKYFRARGRVLAIGFLLLMCTAAVYLDHHWVIDVVVGLAYAALAFGLVRAAFSAPAPSALGLPRSAP